MKKIFRFLIIPAVMIAATMSSCKKDEPLKELEINQKELEVILRDSTEHTCTIRIVDYRTGSGIVGAVVKDNEGVTVATSAENGVVTYKIKAGDEFFYTIEAAGYASVAGFASIMNKEKNIRLSKLDAKLSGIATYTDKSGNLNVVPSGTDIIVSVLGWYVQETYTTKVGANGVFEFSSLPYGADFELPSIIIGSDKYYNSTYIWEAIGERKPMSLNYLYTSSNEIPFTITAYPGKVTPTGNIVIQFNKAVNTTLGDIRDITNDSWSSTAFTKSWSSDKKTLTLTPEDLPWGHVSIWEGSAVYDYVKIRIRLYSLTSDTGKQESIDKELYIRVVE